MPTSRTRNAATSPEVLKAVGRILTSAVQLICGMGCAETSLDEALNDSSPAGLIALRLCASEVLFAYEASAIRPSDASLLRIVGAVIGMPTAPISPERSSALDRATAEMFRRVGVRGFRSSVPHSNRRAIPGDPWQLGEWLSSHRHLAVPKMRSPEHNELKLRRDRLMDALVLALLESNVRDAAVGLRWLAVLPRHGQHSEILVDAIRRTELLAADIPQVRFDCALARKTLERCYR